MEMEAGDEERTMENEEDGIPSRRYINEYEEIPWESMSRASSVTTCDSAEHSFTAPPSFQIDGSSSSDNKPSSKKPGRFNFIFWRRKKPTSTETTTGISLRNTEKFQPEINVDLRRLSSEISNLTNNFAFELHIYYDGGALFYQGYTQSGSGLLVKKGHHEGNYHRRKMFLEEVEALAMFQHPHIVKCFGWCLEGDEHLLAYDHSPNGTLESHLHTANDHDVIPWHARYTIALELASAIYYIHEECESCVLHRNIKPRSVLLDADRHAKLSAFSTAKLVDHDAKNVEDIVVGSWGYIDPYYLSFGIASKASDVYSFGILLLEIASGLRPGTNTGVRDPFNLGKWVEEMSDKGMLSEVADKRLNGEFDQLEMERVLSAGLRCARMEIELRPSMQEVFQHLKFGDPWKTLDNEGNGDNRSPRQSASWDDYVDVTLTAAKVEKSNPDCATTPEQTDNSSSDREINTFAPTPQIELQSTSELIQALQDEKDGFFAVIQTADEDFDVGIPSSYGSSGVPKEYQLQVMRGFMSALAEKLENGARFQEIFEAVRGYTAAIMMLQAPLDNWNSTVQLVLRALRKIESLKREQNKDEVSPRTSHLSSKKAEMERYIASISEGSEQLAVLQAMATSIEQEHASLTIDISNLERQLVECRGRMEDVASRKRVAEERRTENIKSLEYTRAEYFILTLYDSVLSQMNSFP